LGLDEIPARGAEDAQAFCRSQVARGISNPIRTLRAGQVTAPLEQTAEVECAVRVAAFARALVAGLRLLQIAALFEEDPEVDRRGGMAQRIRLSIRAFGGGAITTHLEPKTKVEPFLCRSGAANRCVCAPGHP
jgi:hypothetical protein